MKKIPAWKLKHKSRWCKMALALQEIECIFLFEGQKQSLLYKILLPSACRVFLLVKLFLSQNLISYPSNWSNINTVKSKELLQYLEVFPSPPSYDERLSGFVLQFLLREPWQKHERRELCYFTSTGISVFSPEVSPLLGAFSLAKMFIWKRRRSLFGCEALFGPSFFWYLLNWEISSCTWTHLFELLL